MIRGREGRLMERARTNRLTIMTLQTNTMKTRKSADVVKRLEPVSKALPYVKRKYGSSSRPSLGPVKRNEVTKRQSCGKPSLKTVLGMKTIQ